MPDITDNRKFGEAVLVQWPLDEAVSWISKNLSIEEVFGEDDFQDKALAYAKEQSPEDVFTEKELSDWAENNGYKKED